MLFTMNSLRYPCVVIVFVFLFFIKSFDYKKELENGRYFVVYIRLNRAVSKGERKSEGELRGDRAINR